MFSYRVECGESEYVFILSVGCELVERGAGFKAMIKRLWVGFWAAILQQPGNAGKREQHGWIARAKGYAETY